MKYLNSGGKLQDLSSLRDKILDRRYLIGDYSVERKDSIYDALDKARDDAQRQVEKKEKEMTDQ